MAGSIVLILPIHILCGEKEKQLSVALFLFLKRAVYREFMEILVPIHNCPSKVRVTHSLVLIPAVQRSQFSLALLEYNSHHGWEVPVKPQESKKARLKCH